jgi:hypothetical protein
MYTYILERHPLLFTHFIAIYILFCIYTDYFVCVLIFLLISSYFICSQKCLRSQFSDLSVRYTAFVFFNYFLYQGMLTMRIRFLLEF